MTRYDQEVIRSSSPEERDRECRRLQAQGWTIVETKQLRIGYAGGSGDGVREVVEFVALLRRERTRQPGAAEHYRLVVSADTEGITEMGVLEIAPAAMVQQFGPPSPSDEYKVSGQYVFVDTRGNPFVVHDWKATCLWEPGLLSPQEYWSSEEPDELSISTRDLDTADFEGWLLMRMGLQRPA